MNIPLLIAFTSVFFFGTIHSQLPPTKTGSEHLFLNKEYPADSGSAKIKWTWQLPAPVHNAFSRSHYTSWFIEKIIRYDSAGQTIYLFCLNNGNLLDGDHHDIFLKTGSLYIADNGTILHN